MIINRCTRARIFVKRPPDRVRDNKGEEKQLTVRHPPGKRPAVCRCRAGRGKTRDAIPGSTTAQRCCSPAPTRSRSAYLLTQKIKDRLLLQHTGYTARSQVNKLGIVDISPIYRSLIGTELSGRPVYLRARIFLIVVTGVSDREAFRIFMLCRCDETICN